MKILKRIGIGLLVLVAILGLGGFLLPRHYHVERSRTIAASTEAIQAQITDLQKWQAWNPWADYDPAMKVIYGTPSAGLGANMRWESSEMGNGSITITHITADSIREALDFGPDIVPPVTTFYFKPEGAGTNVRWAMSGDLGGNPFIRWYCLVMDRFIGRDYDKGLEKLAGIVEGK
ncbi:SRPBCC family protein [Nostoc sp. NIES-2111]